MGAPAWAKTDYHSGIWKLLRAGGFSFSENGESSARIAGSIVAAGKQYEIWLYSYEATTGSRHGHYNVLIFERTGNGLSYFGNYSVDGNAIRINGQTIKFDYGKENVGTGYPPAKRGDEIVFDDRGPPPVILLNGEFHWLDPAAHHQGAWHAMEAGRFNGATDVNARIWPAGSIEARGKHLQVWGYAWKQEPWLKDARYKQEQYKVLVFEEKGKSLSYLGSYERDNVAFRVEGRTVKFDLPKSGRPAGYLQDDPGAGIVFDDKGPPAEARINWVTRPFTK
jgi:hypothetical protein